MVSCETGSTCCFLNFGKDGCFKSSSASLDELAMIQSELFMSRFCGVGVVRHHQQRDVELLVQSLEQVENLVRRDGV